MHRCSWLTNGQSCQLTATIFLKPFGDPNPGYCLWHYDCLHTPRLADDYPEFERWAELWAKQGTCGEFSHHPLPYLWEAVRGRIRPLDERLYVMPCRAATCWVPEMVERLPAALAHNARLGYGTHTSPWARQEAAR